jgi:hypothetical protein
MSTWQPLCRLKRFKEMKLVMRQMQKMGLASKLGGKQKRAALASLSKSGELSGAEPGAGSEGEDGGLPGLPGGLGGLGGLGGGLGGPGAGGGRGMPGLFGSPRPMGSSATRQSGSKRKDKKKRKKRR